MRETVLDYFSRTGRLYTAGDPRGRPLGDEEACPTLFRWPGPEGLRDLFTAGLRQLAPGDAVWMTEVPVAGVPEAARAFGVVAVLEPLRLGPVDAGDGLWIGANLPLADVPVAWVPPASVEAALPWDVLATPADVEAAIPAYGEQRRDVEERLRTYLEELSMLRAARVPGVGRPWCAVAEEERRKILADAGIPRRWT